MRLNIDIDINAKEFIDLQSLCKNLDLREAANNDIFKYCLSVILEQDSYDKWELDDALEVIRELTNNEEGFNIIEEVNND